MEPICIGSWDEVTYDSTDYCWYPPQKEALNFSTGNCAKMSKFMASLYNYDETEDLGFALLLSYLRPLIPMEYNPSDAHLLVWWKSLSRDDDDYLFNNTYDMVGYKCGREVCNYFRLEGDPDLAGVGMMVSYYILAMLTTIYFIVISLNAVKNLDANKHWRRLHNWFEQTLNSFLDASLLFSISMLLAAIYRFISDYQNPDGEENTFIYSLINAVTISMFSVFPPLILQLTARRLRRRGIRAVLWFLVIAPVTIMTVLYYRWRGPLDISRFFEDESHLEKEEDRHLSKTAWLVFCDLTNLRVVEALDRAIITAQVLLCLNLPGWIYLLFTIRDSQQDGCDAPQDHAKSVLHHSYSEPWRKYRRWVRGLDIVLCCATMWLLLCTFTAIAVRLADAMGPSSKDRRLSVGQVLAVATFVPVIIDVVAIAFAGDKPEKALQGKMSRSYSVVANRAPHAAKATNAYV